MTAENPHTPVVLSIARFVEKKGLDYLVRAFRFLKHPTAILRIVGYGPEEERLRAVAGNLQLNRIEFVPPVPESELPALYHGADIFVAPCVQTRSGDADGIPTTALEAMACGLPVVCSELLSVRHYVEHGVTGLLVQPRSEEEIANALRVLLDDPERRRAMGAAARARAVAQWDLGTTAGQLEAQLRRGLREQRWQAGVDAMEARRATYEPTRLAFYEEIAAECLAFFGVRGDVLDVGCGNGGMRHRMNGAVRSYRGVDVSVPAGAPPECWQGDAEALPFEAWEFDTVLMYSVLQHVANPLRALTEAHRVLRMGGTLALQVSVNDPNPLFLSWWKPEDVTALVEQAGFRVEALDVLRDRLCVVRATK